MGTFNLDPANPLAADFCNTIAELIGSFLDQRADDLAKIGPETNDLLRLAREFTAGGKRIRPAFCLWGYLAAGGEVSQLNGVLAYAASLDLLHVSALMHDDVMDNSDTRRGMAAAHRQFAVTHQQGPGVGDPYVFGRAGAILLGDLLVMWSAELADQAADELDLPTSNLVAARQLLHQVRTEVTCGQFLDIVAQSHDPLTVGIAQAIDEANRVVEFKSAKYSVQRPVQLGAALAGAAPALLDALAEYGSWLGRAFQFRDDLLGVFGDEATTGKPAGGDLAEGKRTLLLAQALHGMSADDAQTLTTIIGKPVAAGDLAIARQLITASGAPETVEKLIAEYCARALGALAEADLTDAGHQALRKLAIAAAHRDT